MNTRRLLSLLCAALLLAGCAHPAAIRLPTAAAVRAPILAAQRSVARARALDRREQVLLAAAQRRGLAAGSEEARELSSLSAARSQADARTRDSLSEALYRTGDLDRALAADQARIDALARDDAAKTAEVVRLDRSLDDWRLALLCLLVADFFFGAPLQRGLHWLVSAVVHGLLDGWRFALAWVEHAAPFLIV